MEEAIRQAQEEWGGVWERCSQWACSDEHVAADFIIQPMRRGGGNNVTVSKYINEGKNLGMFKRVTEV